MADWALLDLDVVIYGGPGLMRGSQDWALAFDAVERVVDPESWWWQPVGGDGRDRFGLEIYLT